MPNMVVRACVYGVTQAKIKANDQQLTCCDIEEGVTDHLVSGGNTEVLWSDETATIRWGLIRIGGGRSVLFPVKLNKTGGEQGNDTKVASWTYKVTDAMTDEILDENVNPTSSPHQWQRPGIGALREATFGYRLQFIGHLHEAEDESQQWQQLHDLIRQSRKAYQQQGTAPDWELLAKTIEEVKTDARR